MYQNLKGNKFASIKDEVIYLQNKHHFLDKRDNPRTKNQVVNSYMAMTKEASNELFTQEYKSWHNGNYVTGNTKDAQFVRDNIKKQMEIERKARNLKIKV